MNYYLILGEELLLVSDEEIGQHEYFYSSDRNEIHRNDWKNFKGLKIEFPFYYRIIAGTPSLPQITFSEEAYEQMKERFGWVDVEREGDNFALDKLDVRESYHDLNYGFQEGFKLCQSINKNRFSEEDMTLFSEFIGGYEFDNRVKQWFSGNSYHTTKELLQLWKQQRQPKRVKVEVEMEEICIMCKSRPIHGGCAYAGCGIAGNELQTKISNNTIKITRLCK